MKDGTCVRYDAPGDMDKEGSQSGFMDEKKESAAGSEKACSNVNVPETSNKHIRLTGYEVASIEALRDIGTPEIALEALQLFAMIGNRFLLEKAVLYLKKMLEEERLKH